MKKGVKKKIFTLVQSGQLMKLKHYVDVCRKTRPGFHLNFTSGEMSRTPLHVACLLGDDSMTRFLLNSGASGEIVDRDGDTPLHLAAKFVGEEGNYVNHKMIIDPILRNFPDTLNVKNKWKETPNELLQEAKRKHKLALELEATSYEEEFGKDFFRKPALLPEAVSDKAWSEKLATSLDEDCADAGMSHPFFNDAEWAESVPEYTTFDQWADRMAAEYKRKQSIVSEELKRKRIDQKRQKMADYKSMPDRLERERDKYRKKIAEKKANRVKSRLESYQAKMNEHISHTDSKRKLRFKDIPWPCRGTLTEMIDVIMSGYDGNKDDAKEKRKYILKQQILWHPDKFMQRCANELDENDTDNILDTVKLLSQGLNNLLKCL